MNIIKIDPLRKDVRLQWGECRPKLWCYKHFGYRNIGKWNVIEKDYMYEFHFDREQDATFFQLRWGSDLPQHPYKS
jgi:hypothetical protein